MTKEIDDIIVALGGAIMTAAGFYFKASLRKAVNNLCRSWRRRERSSPLRSRLFRDLQSILDDKIPVLNIDCPKRKLMCQVILKEMYECILQESKKLATEPVGQMSNVELACHCEAYLIRLFRVWRIEVQTTDVPKIVVATFMLLTNDHEEIIRNLVRDISLNDLVQDNREKLRIILDAVGSVYSVTLVNAQRTITNLNGELDHVIYRGLSCTCCEGICTHKRSKVE